ncbi:Bifunctional purine biosynthesis protein PurH [Dispira parvispora]|uniref:Bifunctional purine biosynthesis protein PurH n=1 Tax=Dispira parvispora TaxID=1520584 RepID=A0A9W8AUT9_9FUNG|nr:Bifunctional purine biosynthesis protein PurH [Dispira parvispora]
MASPNAETVVSTTPSLTSSIIDAAGENEKLQTKESRWHKPRFLEKISGRMLFCAVVASIGSFNNGFNTSVFNIPEGVIRFCNGVVPPDHKHGALPDCIPMNNFQWGMAVAMFAIGGLVGGLIGGPGITRLGRRGAMLWNNLFLIIGGLLVATTTSVGQTIVGRFIVGIGCGGACVITPTYLNEIATKEARGTLGSMNQLFIVLGILVTESMGLGLLEPPLWRILAGFPAIISVLHMGACLMIEETPHYLALQGRPEEAEKSLRRLRAGRDITEELNEVLHSQDSDDTDLGDELPSDDSIDRTSRASSPLQGDDDATKKSKHGSDPEEKTTTDDITVARHQGTPRESDHGSEHKESAYPNADIGSPTDQMNTASGHGAHGSQSRARFRNQGTQAINVYQLLRNRGGPHNLYKPLLIATIFTGVQQLSGINGVMFYSTSIFQRLYANSATPMHITVGTGGLNLVMTLATLAVVDRWGRKGLTLVSAAGMTIASCVIVGGSIGNVDVLVIACVFFFIAFFAVGLGVTPWLVMTESFPTYARSAASSWCMVINWFCNFIVGLIFPSLQSGLGDFTFVPFAVVTGLFTLFVLFFVPETKGKTPEDIIGATNQREFREDGARLANVFRRNPFRRRPEPITPTTPLPEEIAA